MSKTNDAPTYEITLSLADRLYLSQLVLPDRAPNRTMARMVQSLRRRVELDEGESQQAVQVAEGHMRLPEKDETYTLSAPELELIDMGLEQLSQQGRFPTSDPFLDLDERLTDLIEQSRQEQDEEGRDDAD